VRVLLDVNILVRANEHSQGPARALLRTLIAQRHTILISSEMLVELARVLRYPRVQALYRLSEEQIYEYVQYLRVACEVVRVDQPRNVLMRDPNDIAVLQAAIGGEADVICTLDGDFYDPETREFCAMLGIEVCTDVDLASKLRTG
jgi:putative PIN family toxin of toxin-antitoxin system